MLKKKIIKIIEVLVLIIVIVYICNVAPNSIAWMELKTQFIDVTKTLDIQEGDFVFQDIHGEIFRVIEDVTNSPYTHCGIVVKKDNVFYVLEAIGPVKFTPLNKWIHRGIRSEIAVVRLKEQYQPQISMIMKSSYKYLNRPYDIQYEWDDEKIYCSELIYKAVRDATGMNLAGFRKLGDMNWQKHEEFIRSLEGGDLPLDRKMIAPGDLVTSEKVEVVYNNFRRKNI